MAKVDTPSRDWSESATSRRHVLAIGGGSAFAALVTASLGGRVAAQDASPAASPVVDAGMEGLYAVIRIRNIADDRSADELVELIRNGFMPVVQTVPGFISYVVILDQETRKLTSIGVFADKAAADESTNRAAEWGQSSGATEYTPGDPDIAEGVIEIATGAGL